MLLFRVGIQFFIANGPAIWGGCVTRRKHRAGSWYPALAGPENCHGARRVWRGFCKSRYKFCRSRACRGTSLIGARNLSRCRIYIASRCGRPGASFSRICHGSRVPQKPWQTTYPYCPCYC